MDEKGIALGLIERGKIICHKKDLNHYAIQPGTREWASLIECIGLAGIVLSAYIIFQGQRIQTSWGRAFNDAQASIRVSDKGWTNREISYQCELHANIMK